MANRRCALMAAAVTLAIITGCSGAAATREPTATSEPTPERFTIDGTFTVYDAGGIHLERAGTGARTQFCAGTGGYDDIRPGVRVVVRDGDGSTLATGQLEYDAEADEATEDECPLVFEVDVPRSEFYAIEVGRRGELTYSFEEMETQGWRVDATLGG